MNDDVDIGDLRSRWSFSMSLSELASSDAAGRVHPRWELRAAKLLDRFESDFADCNDRLEALLASNGLTRESLHNRLAAAPVGVQAESELSELTRLSSLAATQPNRDDPWEVQIETLLAPFLMTAREQATRELTANVSADESEWKLRACSTVMSQPPVRFRSLVTAPFVVWMDSRRSLSGHSFTEVEFRSAFTGLLAQVTADPSQWLSFFLDYPTMSRILLRSVQKWSSFCVELVHRLWADRSELSSWLAAQPLTIDDVQLGAGDTHNGLRTVASIRTGEAEFYYKPRPPGVGKGLVRLADEISAIEDEWTVELFLPDSIDRTDYSWVKSISPNVGSRSDLPLYYRRLGTLGAVLWLLNGTDAHCFNVLASSAKPYLLDLETIVTPRGLSATAADSSVVDQTPLTTGVLPTPSSSQLASHVTDFSAFGAVPQKTPFIQRYWNQPGTTNMHLAERYGSLSYPNSLPRVEGWEIVEPYQFREDFLSGFRNTLRFFQRHRSKCLEVIRNIPELSHAKVRVVLRPTAEYAQFLGDILHPAFLEDQMLRQLHFSWLWRNHVDGMSDAVLSAEQKMLLDDEVPYFWTFANSTAIHSGEKAIENEFFDESAWSVLEKRIQALNDDAIARALWVVEAGVATGELERSHNALGACCAEFTNETPSPYLCIEAAEAIIQRLLALSYPTDKGEPVWLDIWSDQGRRWRVDEIDETLYRGRAGLLLLFTIADRFLGHNSKLNSKISRYASSLRAHLGRIVQGGVQMPVGGFEGVGGLLYALGQGPESSFDRPMVELILRSMDSVEEQHESDVSRGCAGAILALLSVLERIPSSQRSSLLDLASQYGARLVHLGESAPSGFNWKTVGETATAGFAHGASGICLSLRLLAEHLPSDTAAEFRRVARDGEAWERTVFDSEQSNWLDLRPRASNNGSGRHFSASWCNGSTGIGLARVRALELPSTETITREHFAKDIAAAVRSAEHQVGLGQTLCHGDLGVALFFVQAGRVLDDEDIIEKGRQVGAMVARDILDHRGAANSGMRYMRDTPGFMNGAAGIAYGLIALATEQSDLPDPLLLRGGFA